MTLIAAMGKRGTAIQRRKDMHAHLLELEQKDRERSAKKRQRQPEPPKVTKGDVVMGGTAAAGPRKASKMRMKLKGKKVKLGMLASKQEKVPTEGLEPLRTLGSADRG